MNVCVFLGPSLAREAALRELPAIYLPPARKGDVYRAARRQPIAIGLVDGYFQHTAAVWHKEILWAMAQGIHVFGSASIGALRAAELHPFGMEGVGAVFRAFRDGDLVDDDEVAVWHGPGDLGYPTVSEAMVNIRATLDRAVAEQVISGTIALALRDLAKAMFYPERTYAALLARAGASGLPPLELAALKTWLPTGSIDQKRQDALAMLQAMRARILDRPVPKRVTYRFEPTEIWERSCAAFDRIPELTT